MTWPDLPDPLPAPVVDSHCHLTSPVRDAEPLDIPEALDRAAAVGVDRIVQVGYDLETSRASVQLAQDHPSLVAAVALHPNEAPLLAVKGELDAALSEIESLAQQPGVRVIGETGLDYFRTGDDGREAQHESFRAHIDLAKRHDLTLMIHDREAHDDVLAVLDDVGWPDRVVMHCFSGDETFARACVERGAWLSFAGTVTFKNAPNLRNAAKVTPIDRILVETDAPWLAPDPFRGRPNASYLLPKTLESLAKTLDCELVHLCTEIAQNADVAFGGPWPRHTRGSG